MSFTDDFLNARQRLSSSSNPKKKKSGGAYDFTSDYLAAREELGLGPIPSLVTNSPNLAPDITTVDDIGPVKRRWFEKGAFEDGYQFGDLTKTVWGTARDVLSDIQVGAFNIVENTIDAGATLLSNVPAWEDELSAFVAKDIIDEKKLTYLNTASMAMPEVILRIIQGEDWKDVVFGDGYEENSVLGDKSDSLAQSGGQLALQYALQGVGVPWWVTSAVSSYGSQAEQAFQEGATAGEANVSALISAGAEVLSEKIFGGFKFQGKALSDGVSDIISRGVSNKLLKGLMKFGLDAGGESIEEVFSSVASRFGQWLTYQDDKTISDMLFSEEAFDEYLESAIGGGLLGGGNTAINITSNAMAGRDPVSGLNSAEEQVVRDLFDSRVSDAESEGNKLSEFDKNKLWDEVVEQMDRGEIAIDDIERILGGDTYKTYQDTVSKEDAIWDEYKTLHKMERGKMTGEQLDREAELKKLTEELDKSTTRSDLADQLKSEVFSVAKDSRLMESYNERVKRGQAFEADVSKYSESERKIIQDAIDSGKLNNTRKTHEFVDWVAKVGGAKGIDFKFTDNEGLRGTQFEIITEDGKSKLPNGYRQGNTIGINTNSKKNVNVVAGHEITHVLEGTELYQALQDAVFRYAVAKDGQAKFDQRLKEVENTYKGVTEDAKGELTADLVGEYLFTDKDFIKRLTTENKSLAKKVFDEIKYMWKLATAGSREKRELERVKKAFEDAYREVGKNSNKSESMDTEVQHSLSHDSEYMDNAIARNDDLGIVESDVLEVAKAVRGRIAQRMNEIKDKGLVGLPEDIAGNTYIANSSYDGTEENTTICPRSLASEAFVDAVSEYLGRPLTVEEQIYISQDLQGRTLTPECIYCYVATDRKAYRAFLGEYINQRDAVLEKLKADPNADVSKSGELYKEFLNGRKDTKPMFNRFKMWVDAYRSGKPMVQASHLANINKLMGDITSEFGDELKPQIVDAMKYAQSASWAKKRVNYVAYNGHILKWKQDRINKLNSHYGLRMYSFSDFHPAFVLENMQMITDASVRGLKMLGYTKDTDFVEIFAPTGMNINISTFGFESGGEVFENNLTGAAWDKARELRDKHPNVGITFVATNDTLVNWALDQDWIDVIIPYHLVRTGEAVAKAMNYTNYTKESSDTKGEGWKKGDKKYIAPTEHNNDKATYLSALERNHLKPRFSRFLDNPNYMKLVNECRQPASQSQPVQPVFNEEAANEALAKLEANGYYQPIGGSVDRMYEIAGEVAEAMTQEVAPTQMSLSEDSDIAPGDKSGVQYSLPVTDEETLDFLNDQVALGEYDAETNPNGGYYVTYKSMSFWGYDDDGNAILRSPMAEYVDGKLSDAYLIPADKSKINWYRATETIDEKTGFPSGLMVETKKPGSKSKSYVSASDNQHLIKDDWSNLYFLLKKKVLKNGKWEPSTVPARYNPYEHSSNMMLNDQFSAAYLRDNLVTVKMYVPVSEDNGAFRAKWSKDPTGWTDWKSGIVAGKINQQKDLSRRVFLSRYSAPVEIVPDSEVAQAYKEYLEGTTVAIPDNVVSPNLLKELRNAGVKITESGKVQYSLSGDSDIAPIKHGKYNVSGKDITLDTPYSLDDIAPVAPKKTYNIVKDSRFVPGAKKNDGIWSWAKEHLLDNGMVFEDLAKKSNNRELEAKWNFIRNAPSAANHLLVNGDKKNGIKALKSIIDEVDKAGKTDSFNDYLLHFHNIDRMSLESRFPDSFNKPVFGDRVTAEQSMARVEELEKANPEFKAWAREVYAYNDFLRGKLVDAGIITQETSDLWADMYPHYVPIYRDGEDGFSIDDSIHLGINAPVKRATGGNSKMLNVLDAMASRTLQTFKAVAKNNFGVELMNTLGSVVEHNETHMDEFTGSFDMDSMFSRNGGIPTYTVYNNGERATFEITDEMYEAMKPKKGITQKKIPVLSHINSIFRGLTTQYNPVFALTNPIKDVQEVLLNSQHPGKTYGNILSGRVLMQMATKGQYYQEYLANGGQTNTYFDDETKTFKEEPKAKQFLDKVFAFNDYIEMTPRLAEYIASRESGKGIEESMLDAARVTTNFSAGGDVTKFLNRNGATFLNASVQGAIQQVRNVREANQKGLMGYVGLATRWAIGGLVPVLLNNLMWDDDEDYEDLADYVKQDYYIIGKYGDGKFIRIPKGRALAVLQEAMDIVMDTATGDDEVDMARYLALGKMAIENIAPNNPMDNNIFAPIKQVATNKTWYGEDLVPSRLADLPSAEQYDEKTDSISKWLGETFNVSPYKINYLLNQYSGGIGDFFLPMLTPRAESGDDSLLGAITAPFRDKFTTDSVLNSQTVSDFYDTCDELERNANSMNATEDDAFKYMYMRSVSFDASKLYQQKREIQNSDLPDSEKYELTRELQAQINAMMEEALGSYADPHIDGLYAEVGSKRFNKDQESGEWYEIKSTNADGSDNWYYQMEQEVTQGLGISYGEYWNNREEYNFAYQKPGKYAIAQSVGGYQDYLGYSDAMYDIHADKDENGKSINGTRKRKIIEYVNGLDCEYGMKIILYKSEYPSDDTYNYDLIEYLNSRDDISYQQMETILKELGFNVDSSGRITW